MKQRIETLVSAMLSLALLTVACAKLVDPYRETYALPSWVYYGSALCEALVALCLQSRIRKHASMLAIVMFACAVVATAMMDGNCG